MNRNKKLLRNVIIIILYLLFTFYFGGRYLSKEKCDIATMRSLYANETTYVMEFNHKNHYATIYTNPEEKTMSIIGCKKRLLTYVTTSTYTRNTIDSNEIIDIFGAYGSDMGGMISVVYRNNPKVVKVEACYENGTCVLLDDWKEDFAGVLVEGYSWYSGIYKAYDNQGNLLAEIEY